MNSGHIRKAGECILALTTAGCAAATIVRSLAIIRLPYQLDFGEGEVLNGAVRLAQGMNPYPDPRQWPVVLDVYGPLAYLLAAIPVRLAGVGFTGPRLIVVLSAAAVSVLAGLLIWHYARNRSAAVAFGALFLCITVVYPWVVLLRVDMPALALALAGLWLFAVWPERWLWAGLVFVAALFCKWTMLAAPAACVAWLLSQRQWKRAGQMVAWTGLLTALVLGALQWATGGFFAFHMFGTHSDPYQWRDWVERFRVLLLEQWILVALTGVYLLAAVRAQRLTLPAAYIPLAMLGTLTAGKLGANSNHMLEMAAALCMGAGLGWADLAGQKEKPTTETKRQRGDGDQKIRNAVVAVAAVALAVIFWRGYWFTKYPFAMPGCEAAYRFVRQHAGEHVLSGDVGAVLLAGKTVMVSDPYAYSQLVKHGGWSDKELQDKLRSGYFDLVLTSDESGSRAERWTPAVRQALAEGYRPVERFYCTGVAAAWKRK